MRLETRKKVLRMSSLTLVALGAPLAFSPAKGVTTNDACAGEGFVTCCPQPLGWCCDASGCIDKAYDNGSGPDSKCPAS